MICLDATTGELRWQIDLVRQYGTQVPDWYAGQCPLVDHDRVILAPAGKATALGGGPEDRPAGPVLWKSPTPAAGR